MQGDNRVVNRIARLLESANFNLGSVASNIVGKTGWLILNATARGETDPDKFAERAQGSGKSLAGKSRRGRPCKCAERGLICKHRERGFRSTHIARGRKVLERLRLADNAIFLCAFLSFTPTRMRVPVDAGRC